MSKHYTKRPNTLIITIVILSMAIAALAMVSLSFYSTAVHYRNHLENGYQRAFFDLTSNMNNLEIKLSKLMVTSSKTQIQKNLNDVSRQSDNTQSNLAQLPTTHETINKTMRFVNQLSDYSGYLSNKVAKGDSLNNENYDMITNLYEVNKKLSIELKAMANKLGSELKMINEFGNGEKKSNPVSDGFNNMQENSIDYPKMIYDGPFSDAIIDAEITLSGEEISKEEAEVKLKDYFKDLKISEVNFQNETTGKIATYDFNAKLESGHMVFIQISKIGGRAVLLDNQRSLDNYTLEVDECIAKAESFAQSLGYNTHKGVWASDYNGLVYINLAPVINDIIYYPDLIKVVIARDNGEVTGLETMSYLANHKERKLDAPALSVNAAQSKISSKLEIVSKKLVLIPQAGNKEILAYEFAGEWNDLKYFVFIDAKTGDEVDVFRVIDSEQGSFIV